MKVSSFQKLNLSSSNIDAYMTKINIFENKKFIFPHEETSEESHITKDIIKNSVIVLGVTFLSVDTEIIIEDNIFILDGHHRFKFIVENKIDEIFEVVLIDLHSVNIESHNCELNIDIDSFIKKIKSDYSFNDKNRSSHFIKINQKEYWSEDFSNIYELYKYKKELMSNRIISPIANSEESKNLIVNFSPISPKDLSNSRVFPYKSTWITPRFDS